MTSERWRQVERLYHGALERPAAERDAFLLDACDGDDALRQEVRSLLNQPSMPDFLAQPAVTVAAAMVSDPGTAQIGRQIGTYQFQALIGRGGMGEVYRAHDTRLGRDVALKLLPPAFTTDSDRLARFAREARLLASLNHPNIGTIHGLEEAEGVRALVLELVEGDTLADRVARGPVPVPEALAIARQIADALEAAHDKGIVHRDLKPANIKITPDGAIKVLDFGLAKSDPVGGSGPDLTNSPTISGGVTEAGIILGTAAYMSPEQARGRAVDKRTDVWAFGCVLYELLTGRGAFAGETVSDTIGAIIHREPDWNALPPALPAGVTTALRRCLEKDLRRRRRDIGDVRADLEDAVAAPTATPSSLVGAGVPPSRTSRVWPWATAVLAIAVAAGVWFWPQSEWQNPLAGARYTPLTADSGIETAAALSPDGRFVAFLSDRAGQFDVWLTQIGTGRLVNLTQGKVDARPNCCSSMSVGFTSDGSEIWVGGTPAGRRLIVLPLLGGVTRPFLGEKAQNVSWARDGSRLVYFNSGNGDPMFVADRTGGSSTPLYVAKAGLHNHAPVWSADARWIYFFHGVAATNEMDLWRIPSSGGEPEPLTTNGIERSSAAVLDDRTVLYVGRSDDAGGPWLWAFDVDTKRSHRVTSGLERYTSIAANADGRRLVASVSTQRASLWSVPILGGIVPVSGAQPHPVPSVRALAPRLRSDSLYYLSALGTGDGLWRLQNGQTAEIWRGSQGVLLEPPAISPDGLRIAVVVRKGGRKTLTVVTADGAESRTLGESIDVQGTTDWSPDGAWVVAGGADANGRGLFKIPAEGGGAPVRLLSGIAVDPIWSVNDVILFHGEEVSARVPLHAVRPDGEAVALPAIQAAGGTGKYRFLPSGDGVVFLAGGDRPREFWFLDLKTKAMRALTNISSETERLRAQGDIGTFDITPDGKQIIFDRMSENSDIVLIDLPPR